MELGNHSEFLGVMTRAEMLAMYFVHDGGETSKWRLKGHAADLFWRWLSSWCVVMDDPKKLGAPEGFTLTIRSVRVSAGAGFVVALSGDIMTMPGLPKVPAAVNIDVTDDGKITGLF